VRIAARRTRLIRGPLTVGEPGPLIDPRLSEAEPYRPDTVADGGAAFGLTVRAASVRGLGKRYGGGPRQDDLCLRLHHPTRTLIVAVADGVSGAARSDLGAALAVRHAVAAVGRQLEDGAVELDWSEVFEQASWALIEEHRRERGEPSAGVEEAARSLATTLIVAAVSAPEDPAWGDPGDAKEGDRGDCETYRVQVAAVGDSPAYVLANRKFDLVVGDTEQVDGLLGGGVQALPRHARAIRASARTLGTGEVLLVCTDGLSLPLADGHGEVGRVLARELSNPPDIVDFARLLDFSRNTYDDDRTLVAVWPGLEP
jgi:serine/threonine protein phosphatase PrpC